MKFFKRNTTLLTVLPICLCIASSAASAADYSFFQSGFSGGGVISGSFSGVDKDGDGLLSSFSNEILDFTLTFSGDSIVGGFTHTYADMYGLVYTLGSPVLGNALLTEMEGIASNWPSATSGFEYATGFGPTNGLGGYAKEIATGLISSTEHAVNVSAVPEPEAYSMLLAGLGFVGLIARRRKQLSA
ncbi:MAG: PEP-CTERM sorting domain-containing protein [Ferribacterium limneticum]